MVPFLVVSCGDAVVNSTVGAPALVPWLTNAGAVVYEWSSPNEVAAITISTCSEETNFETTTLIYPQASTFGGTAFFVETHLVSAQHTSTTAQVRKTKHFNPSYVG